MSKKKKAKKVVTNIMPMTSAYPKTPLDALVEMEQKASKEEPVTVVEETAETEQATEEEAAEAQPPKEASTKRKPRKKSTDIVQVKVIFGSVGFKDQGHFEVGDTFTCTREQAETIDKRFVEILE